MPNINLDRFSGFADVYDKYRPRPCGEIADAILHFAGMSGAGLVVDLGSGTGLSTRIWLDRAKRIVGIEPNPDMRKRAQETNPDPARIEFREGSSYDTGLDDGCADVVVCGQSFHWMEPAAALKEIDRILRPGGVFAAFDNDWPPTVNWKVDRVMSALFDRARELSRSLIGAPDAKQWPKEKHLESIRNSGHFEFCEEIVLRNVEDCDAERIIGIAQSQGHFQDLRKAGSREIEAAFRHYETEVRSCLGRERWTMGVGYRIRAGVKRDRCS